MKESLKLICSFLYSSIVAFSTLDYIFLLPLIIVLFIEKDQFFSIIKKSILLNFFIIVLVVFVLFQNQDEAIALFIRTNLILLFNITLFFRSKGYDIARGLDGLNFPSKIVSVFYFTLSLINYLVADFKETKNTLRSRGFRANTSMFTYQTYGNIFAMIFIKALRKSEDMSLTMRARGFEDKIYFLNTNKADIYDKVLFFSIVIIFIKVVYELFS
jgi:cobalt/nickel transport system permease protein